MASARERQVEEFCSRIPCAGCGNPESPLGSHDCDAKVDLYPRAPTSVRRVFEEHNGHLQRINGPSPEPRGPGIYAKYDAVNSRWAWPNT